jgi:hypothetical protein
VTKARVKATKGHAGFQVAVDRVGAKHMLATSQTDSCKRSFPRKASSAINAPSTIEPAGQKDAIDPSLQDGWRAEPKNREDECQHVSGEHVLDLPTNVGRQRAGGISAPLLQRVDHRIRRRRTIEIRRRCNRIEAHRVQIRDRDQIAPRFEGATHRVAHRRAEGTGLGMGMHKMNMHDWQLLRTLSNCLD